MSHAIIKNVVPTALYEYKYLYNLAWTNTLHYDKIRNRSFSKTFPELKDAFGGRC